MKDYEEKVLNIMESAKDSIKTQLDKAYKSGYEDAKSELGKNAINIAHAERDIAYQQGLGDAWEFVQKLAKNAGDGGYTASLLQNALGYCNLSSIVLRYDINEAMSQIKEYEEQQNTIRVWDEVYSEMNDLRFIVTRIITSKHMDITVKRYEGICTDGACYDNLPEDIVKTGRTFPQIAEVLTEMRGEKE